MASFQEAVGEWLLDLVGFIGLALGGGQAAASGPLQEMQQDSLQQASTGGMWMGFPLRGTVNSIDALASMVVKGVLPFDDAWHEAQFLGMQRGRFDDLVKATGNPPGPMDLLTLWRRHHVTEHDVDVGMQQGHLKNDWIPFIKNLFWEPLTTNEAVQAAVEQHVGIDWARAEAAKSGTSPELFDILYETAGNPPGPQEMLDLWNRGDVDEATVDQALRESRLKNKYIDVLKKRARRLVPMRTITTLLHGGAVTDAHAVEMLQQLGFNQADAQAIVNASHFEKVAPDKTLTVTQIRDLYTSHMIGRDQAIADLAVLHFPENVAVQVLDLADREISRRDRTTTITKIRNAYLSRRIDRANASGDLDVIGVDAGQRDALLGLWDLELDNNVALLTVAEICRAGKLGLITADEVLARLSAHGYSDADTILVAQVHAGIPLPPTTP